MKNRKLIAVLAAVMIFTACSDVPDTATVTSSSPDTLMVSSADSLMVESEKAYADMDAAYSAGLKKVGLPDRETVDATAPEGVYELELEIINRSADENWMTEKTKELAPIFGSEEEISKMKIKTAKLSAAYMINSAIKGSAVTPLCSEEITSCEITPLNKKTSGAIDEKSKQAISITEGYNRQAKAILGDQLESIIHEADCYQGNNGTGYGVHIEKAYKNVPILPYTALNPNLEVLDESNELCPLDGYCFFDRQLNTVLYHPDSSYKAVKAEKIDKIISFKGACELLEENLGNAAHYDFDKVALMYDPRVDRTSGEDFPNIRCRPKWYFITFSEDFFSNAMQTCFTVDGLDGTIEVI